ncbi:MAG: DUF202 domain-containing protein [Bacteroidales bacterium]|nr:DUF202 domain-containing protein [Bacteroidales bacterium]
MVNENPYLNELNKKTDDELFDIIANTDESEDPFMHEAAISIALERELITEYQAKHLLEGNIAVLEYNPENIDNQELEKEAQESHEKSKEKNNVRFGLSLMGGGALLILYFYNGGLIFPVKTLIIGITSMFVGIVLLIIGLIEKNRRKNNTEENID